MISYLSGIIPIQNLSNYIMLDFCYSLLKYVTTFEHVLIICDIEGMHTVIKLHKIW